MGEWRCVIGEMKMKELDEVCVNDMMLKYEFSHYYATITLQGEHYMY